MGIFTIFASVGDPSSWKNVYKRIDRLRRDAGLSWSELATLADIKMKTWMTGLNNSHPTDEELRKIAPVLGTTYEYLRYGTENI